MYSWSNEGLLKQLETLQQHIGQLELATQLVPPGEQFTLPTLFVKLPDTSKNYTAGLMINPVPMENDGGSTALYQFYVELPLNLEALDETALLREVDALNRQLPLGQVMTISGRQNMQYPKMVGARYMYTTPVSAPVDRSSFLEVFLLFVLSCDMIMEHFEKLATSKV